MIDTVRFAVGGRWTGARPDHWTRQADAIVHDEDGGSREQFRVLMQGPGGLRLFGDQHGPTFAEVSLPRLVHPHNGRLLKCQAEVDQAKRALGELVSSVVDGGELGRLTRRDLVWQFEAPEGAPAWVAALASARHPRIRKEPITFFGQSVAWRGKECVIRAYDKKQELDGKPGDVLRIETQTRGKRLVKSSGQAGGTVAALDFAGCWRVFRADVVQLPAFRVIPRRSISIGGFLGLLAEAHVELQGRPAQELYLAGRSERQQRRLRREIQHAMLFELAEVQPVELLPESGPPEAVEVA